MDVDLIKQAARGRWVEILSSILGFPAEVLDGNHHPCPGCGGSDRFRIVDVDAGACLCNQCLTSKNGDGIAVIQHYLGVNFIDASKKVAEYLGVPTDRKTSKKKKSIEEVLEVKDLNDALGAVWAPSKQTSLEVLRLMGARHGSYRKQYPVLLIPILGESGKPVGWTMYAAAPGGMLPKWKGKGVPPEMVKTKVADGSEAGLVAPKGWKDAEIVWKVEGVTDCLALNAVLPAGQVAVTNSNGASENPRQWIRDALAGKKVIIIGDADVPGQQGADKWAAALSQKSEAVCVKLPYPVVENHGKDVRDFLADRGADALFSLSTNFAPTIKSDEEIPEPSETDSYAECLEALRLEVLFETERGKVTVYCSGTKKTREIQQVERMKHENLIQLVGQPAVDLVVHSDPKEGQYSLAHVRRAISLTASQRAIDSEDTDIFGRGVWKNENETVLVNGNHLSVWDGTNFRKTETAVYRGMICRLTGGKNWYDHQEVEKLIQNCQSDDFRKKTLNESIELVERWTWQHQSISGELITGMIVATFIQSMFSWRPQISICGESNTGKTSFFKVLCGDSDFKGIAGRLAWKVSDTSAAGIRQDIGNNSYFVAVDEWDAMKRKPEILKLLRSSGPGDKVVFGSSSHQSKKFGLRHLCWLAGVYSDLVEDVDRNRFVSIDLVKPPIDRWKAFRMPTPCEAFDLGKRLMAIAVWGGYEMVRVADRIASMEFRGVHERQVRNLGVAAASLAVAHGGGEEAARRILEVFAASFSADEESATVADHKQILEELLMASIDCGRGDKRIVGDLLSSSGEYLSHSKSLEGVGVAVKPHHDSNGLFVSKSIWDPQKRSIKTLRQILGRIPGAKSVPQRMSGILIRGIWIPWDYLVKHFDLPQSPPTSSGNW